VVTHPTLSGEALEVFFDVLGQERSALFDPPNPRGPGDPLDRLLPRDPISRFSTYLSRAERHLVSVHRSEVASWLRRVAHAHIFADPNQSGLMGTEVAAGQNHRPESADVLFEAGEDLNKYRAVSEEIWAIAQVGRRPGIEATGVLSRGVSIGIASLRLEPHPVPTAWFGFEQLRAGHTLTVERLLAGIVEVDASGAHRGLMELRAAHSALCGDWSKAASSYRAAALGPDGGAGAAIWWLLNAMQSGDEPDGLQADAALAQLGGITEIVWQEFAQMLLRARAERSWRPTPQFDVGSRKWPIGSAQRIREVLM